MTVETEILALLAVILASILPLLITGLVKAAIHR